LGEDRQPYAKKSWKFLYWSLRTKQSLGFPSGCDISGDNTAVCLHAYVREKICTVYPTINSRRLIYRHFVGRLTPQILIRGVTRHWHDNESYHVQFNTYDPSWPKSIATKPSGGYARSTEAQAIFPCWWTLYTPIVLLFHKCRVFAIRGVVIERFEQSGGRAQAQLHVMMLLPTEWLALKTLTEEMKALALVWRHQVDRKGIDSLGYIWKNSEISWILFWKREKWQESSSPRRLKKRISAKSLRDYEI